MSLRAGAGMTADTPSLKNNGLIIVILKDQLHAGPNFRILQVAR